LWWKVSASSYKELCKYVIKYLVFVQSLQQQLHLSTYGAEQQELLLVNKAECISGRTNIFSMGEYEGGGHQIERHKALNHLFED